MKKILTLALIAAAMVGSATAVKAAHLEIDQVMLKSTFPGDGIDDRKEATVSTTTIKDYINNLGATYKYIADDGTEETGKVTANMCFYGPSETSECVANPIDSRKKSFSIYVIYKKASHSYSSTVSTITNITWPDTIGPKEYLAGVPWDPSDARIYYTCANGFKDYEKVNTGMIYLAETAKEYTKFYGDGTVIDAQSDHSYSKDGWKDKAAVYRVVLRWHGYNSATDFKESEYREERVQNDADKTPILNILTAKEQKWFYPSKYNNSQVLTDPDYFYTIKDFVVFNLCDSRRTTESKNLINDVKARLRNITYYYCVSSNATKYYDITVLVTPAYLPEIQYRAHVQNIGWQGYEYSADTAGTEGKSLRMEALQVNIVNLRSNLGSMKYSAHVQYQGDQSEVTLGKTAGTTGMSRRMEGVKLEFTGQYAQRFDVYYRVHVQKKGWMEWVKNGEYAGTTGQGLRMEAIQIKSVLKDA